MLLVCSGLVKLCSKCEETALVTPQRAALWSHSKKVLVLGLIFFQNVFLF